MKELADKNSALHLAQVKAVNVSDIQKQLIASQSKHERTQRKMEENLEEEKLNHRASLSAIRDELQLRREKQYTLLDRIAKVEDEKNAYLDENEKINVDLNAARDRIRELENRMTVVNNLRAKEVEEHHLLQAQIQNIHQQFSVFSRNAENEKTFLKEKIAELDLEIKEKSKVLESCRKKNIAHVAQLEENAKTEKNLLHKIETLQQEAANQGKLRMQALVEGSDVLGKKKIAQMEIHLLRKKLLQTDQKLLSVKKEFKAEKKKMSLQHQCLAINVVKSVSVSMKNGVNLDFSSCGIDDKTLSLIVKSLRDNGLSHIRSIDLSENNISDRGARRIALFLAKSPRIELINLARNRISVEGIRAIAGGLEKNTRIGIEHVYVHMVGKVEALGYSMHGHGAYTKKGEIESLVCIDVQNNQGEGSAENEKQMLMKQDQKEFSLGLNKNSKRSFGPLSSTSSKKKRADIQSEINNNLRRRSADIVRSHTATKLRGRMGTVLPDLPPSR